jgi:uncharacterized protein (DUF4415 family)
MAKSNIAEFRGFDELNVQLKKLNDKVKREEVLKILRKMAEPFVEPYKNSLPLGKQGNVRFDTNYVAGSLRNSVSVKTVPASKTGGNPSVVVRPGKRTTKGVKYDAFYHFMVVRKGSMTSSEIRRGASRMGKNTVVDDARNKAWAARSATTIRLTEDAVEKFIQQQINRLSNK